MKRTRRTTDPRQLSLGPASQPARAAWHSEELPQSRVFGGDDYTPTPLTPRLVDSFRKNYEDVLEDVYRAQSYAEARNALRRLAFLEQIYARHTGEALAMGLEAQGLQGGLIRKYRTSVAVPEFAWRVPIDARDTSLPAAQGESVAFQKFVRESGPWMRRARSAFQKAAEMLWLVSRLDPPVVLYLERRPRTMVEGVSVGIAPMSEKTAARALDVLGAALRLLRSQARVPWLMSRMPPLALVIECRLKGETARGMYHVAEGVVDLCASELRWMEPREAAKVIAHEVGHHIWRKSLSNEAHAEWQALVLGTPWVWRVVYMLADWKPTWTVDEFVASWVDDPVMYLRLRASRDYGHLSRITREDLVKAAKQDPDATMEFYGSPITAYAAKNPEEAFCEALGLLAAYGPRTVDPEVQQWLRTVLPSVHTKRNARPRKRNAVPLMAVLFGIGFSMATATLVTQLVEHDEAVGIVDVEASARANPTGYRDLPSRQARESLLPGDDVVLGYMRAHRKARTPITWLRATLTGRAEGGGYEGTLRESAPKLGLHAGDPIVFDAINVAWIAPPPHGRKANDAGRSKRRGTGHGNRRKRNAVADEIALYRATSSARPRLGPGTSWTPDPQVAELYTRNPGFGGDAVFEVELRPEFVLDLTRGRSYTPDAYGAQYGVLRAALAEADAWPALEARLQWGPRGRPTVYLGDYVHNLWENDREVFEALASLYSWVVFYDDFPEGAVTWSKLDAAPLTPRRVR